MEEVDEESAGAGVGVKGPFRNCAFPRRQRSDQVHGACSHILCSHEFIKMNSLLYVGFNNLLAESIAVEIGISRLCGRRVVKGLSFPPLPRRPNHHPTLVTSCRTQIECLNQQHRAFTDIQCVADFARGDWPIGLCMETYPAVSLRAPGESSPNLVAVTLLVLEPLKSGTMLSSSKAPAIIGTVLRVSVSPMLESLRDYRRIGCCAPHSDGDILWISDHLVMTMASS